MAAKQLLDLIWIILLIIIPYWCSGCKNSPEYIGRYCANDKYHNPNTSGNSEYTLKISVKNNKLFKLDFPLGYLAHEDLPATTFSKDGHTSLFYLMNMNTQFISLALKVAVW